jgi:hypothetical protein
MEPWTGADKHAAYKIIRSIVAIRSTSIWRIVVISIRTCRGRPNISRPRVNEWRIDSNSDADSNLRTSCSGQRKTNSKQNRIL